MVPSVCRKSFHYKPSASNTTSRLLLPDVCTIVILVWTVLSLLKLTIFLSLSLFLLPRMVCVCVCVVASKFLHIAGSTKLVPSPLPHPSALATTGAANIATAVAFLAECIQDCHTKAQLGCVASG